MRLEKGNTAIAAQRALADQEPMTATGRKLLFARHDSGHPATYLPATCWSLSAAHPKPVIGLSPALMLVWPVWDGDRQEALRLRAAAIAAQQA